MDDGGGGYFLFVLLWALLISGPIGAAIGNKKGAGALGYFVGVLLGPIGWIIMLVAKGDRIPCPSCRELIDPEAKMCPKCHSRLSYGKLVMPMAEPRPVTQSYSRNAYPDLPMPSEVPPSAEVPPPPKRAAGDRPGRLRVSRDGQDLGRVDLQEVRSWLQSGELTFADHYFDSDMGQWLTLDCHPQLADLHS